MKISPHLLVFAVVATAAIVAIARLPAEAGELVGQGGQTGPALPHLAAYGIDSRQTSVSGISSGGAMAVQMHVAHSAIMRGVGVVAGVAYDCTDSRLNDVRLRLLRALPCMAGTPGAAATFSIARTAEAAAVPGAIDALSNLAGQKVWLFSGYNDGSVRRAAMNAVDVYYQNYVDAGNLFYQMDSRAPHALITDDYGGPCLGFNDQYINNCDYDAAGHLLKYIYGHLNPRSSSPDGSILAFDQSEFAGGVDPKSIGLAETGYLYVPAACLPQNQPKACRVHVVFHGCRQYADNPQIGKAVVEHGGYNRWSDTNDLIVLYPQAIPTPPISNSDGLVRNPGNSRGCWDWWGYSDLPRSRDFARKTGYQIAAIRAMIDRLAEGFVPGGPSDTFGSPQDAAVTDRTSRSLALTWQPNRAAAGFNIYRSLSSAGPFVQVASMVKGASFADRGLARNTAYHYEIRAVDASNNLSPPAGPISGTTAATDPPACDPYFSDNHTHVINFRALATLGGAVAAGSFESMGPVSDQDFSQLTKEERLVPFYRVRYCP